MPNDLHTVIHSVEREDGLRCVDIFQRLDSTFGFEEFRRDVEDSSGWFSTKNYLHAEFSSAEAALEQAKEHVHWIGKREVLPTL